MGLSDRPWERQQDAVSTSPDSSAAVAPKPQQTPEELKEESQENNLNVKGNVVIVSVAELNNQK